MRKLRQGIPARRHASLRTALLGSAVLGGIALATVQTAARGDTPPPANAGIVTVPAEAGYADLAAAVMPAVVNVRVERTGTPEAGRGQPPPDDPETRDFLERFFGQPLPPNAQPQPHRMVGEGSGFIVGPDGYIVTNFHVAGEADRITVTTRDGSTYRAALKGADRPSDLAVIKIEAARPLPYLTWGDSDKVRPGDRVIAVGNPFGLGGTVTAGIVSATGREIGEGPYDDFIQIDAPINRGNSGGPTFDLKGEVIGVNTAIFSPSGGSVGIGFAIASNQVRQIVDQLRQHGTVDRGFLGVSVQSVDEDAAKALKLDSPKGALVSKVEPDSPAAKAGLRPGDVVLELDGKPVEKVTDLSRRVAATPAGKTADVVLWRDGKRETVRVEVGRMPNRQEMAAKEQGGPADGQPRLGLGLAPLTPETRARLGLDGKIDGVVVTEVRPDSPADQKGVQPGDVIVSVDRKPVKEPDQVAEAVRAAHAGGDQAVLLLIDREGRQMFTAVPLATS